ncbi:hypothetical protein G9A89_019813 [Geosiphon pyriformis]|nr:hypothetical protein G9A89_019813 [Geosiphon pyriformis]
MEKHFEAHNKNNLDFIEFNLLSSCLIRFSIEDQSSRQFQDFWNWFLNKHSAEIYTAYITYYFDQTYFEDNFEERNNTTETPFETEEESYQTALVFDFLSSELDLSTQTVISEPMTNNPMQANILVALQGIQTALQRKNNTPLPLFRGNAQDPIEWLDDFKRAFQIVGGYLQDSSATWFLQETDANAQHQIIRWTPTNTGEKNTSFIIQFETKIQDSGEVVTEYAKAIRKLIKHVNSERNWTKEQKIYFFTKRLKTDLSYALWPLLTLKDNLTMNMAIELAQRIEDNQRIHLKFTLLVFASAPIIAPAPQMAAIFFAAQTQNSNKQENQQPQRPRFEPYFNQSQQLSYQRQQNHGPSVCYHCGLTGHFSKKCNNSLLFLPAPRNNDTQNNRPNNNNIPNPKPNHVNINFFEENSLVEATSESASQPEKNSFYVFNLTNDNHDMNELAINTSEPTRKKKKAKIDFVIDPKKASTSIANNNKLPKAKVFKNPLKLESSKIVQKSGPYSVVKDLIETPAYIIFSHNVTPLICKAQVAGYFIDLILNSKSSVSVIAKHFLKAIGRKIDELSTKPIINVHGDKKKGLGIAKTVPVRINGISIKTDMEVSEAKKYIIIVGNEWLKKAKALLDYELCELTIRCGEKPIVVKCYYWTTPLVT